MKIMKTGLFIDQEADTEKPQIDSVTGLPMEDGTLVTILGEWFWKLIARNGNVIAGNRGFNTSQSALKSIRATRNYFKANKFLKVYNVVTGELKSNNK